MLRTILKTEMNTLLAAEAVAEALGEIAIDIDDVIARAVALSYGSATTPQREQIATLRGELQHFAFLLDCALRELEEVS